MLNEGEGIESRASLCDPVRMSSWTEGREGKTLDWPGLVELLLDMVARNLGVVVTVGSETATAVEMEGCLVAHQHQDPRDRYLERESFGLWSSGVYVGGFEFAPSQFKEARFWNADGLYYFTLIARFDDLVVQIADQSLHGSGSSTSWVP